MKLYHKILAAVAGIVALSSCVEEAIKPLEGKYEKPVTYELNTLVDQSVEKGEKLRTFTVEVANQEASLKMKFAGDKYYLVDESYTASPEAKKGTYLVGEGGSTFTKGGTTLPVESGTLVVKQENGTYNMSGTLWLADESAIKIVSSVALVYEADPEPVKPLNMADVVTPVADATGAPVAGVEKHNITLTEGEATVAIFELLTAEGADIAGTYTCQEYASAAGLMGNGYSFPDWGIEGGSRYWVDGQLVLINAGETLEVTKVSEGVYKFVGSTGYEFTATAGNGGGNGYVKLSSFLSLTSYLGYGMNMVGVELGTEGFTYSLDATYQPVYGVDGNYLKLELYSADGTVAPGTYTACAVGGTVGEGEFGIGYDGMWGASGTTWYTVAGGVATYQYITDGTVTVEVSGDKYTVTVESSLVNAQFVGTFAQ